jgi:hypothetical protein
MIVASSTAGPSLWVTAIPKIKPVNLLLPWSAPGQGWGKAVQRNLNRIFQKGIFT